MSCIIQDGILEIGRSICLPRERSVSMDTLTPAAERAEQSVGSQTIYTVDPVAVASNPVYLTLKRLADIAVALLCGGLLLLPMAIIALIIRAEDRGPALFRQERLGKDGKPFVMYKFRSMRVDAEENGPQWAQREDSRCTKVGQFLRKTRLDELPQLWNILLGHMSLVGPRPERSCFYEEFETYIHGFRYRLAVRPGLTGWAQVNGGYDLAPEEKIVFDMEYIQKRSVLMDLKCLLRTVTLVFTHEGAR